MRSVKDYILLFLKGIGMGGADVVPGVSGGTIAFITGIYEELLRSIKSFDTKAVQLVLRGRFSDFWKHINGGFLSVLLAGIILSILSLARIIHYFLEQHPIQLWSFFFGLIIISAITVTREITKWNYLIIGFGIVGIVTAYFITDAAPASTPEGYLYIFMSGAIAICAMILPGISGSFILLILGKYQFIISALKDLDIAVLVVFALGCITGLLSFARLISWFLNKYHNIAIALLAGFMIGSLNKIWPWKETITFRTDRTGDLVPLLQENILPNQYLAVTGESPQMLMALLFAAIGVLIVIIIEKIANYNRTKRS
jgi:putative membrane protein